MQKINLFGMELADYSLKESVEILERFLHTGALNTILYISAKMLVGAGISAEQKKWIENIDLIRWSDPEILEQAGVKERGRIHEIETHEFIREFLKRLTRYRDPVYLLAETEEELERLQKDLLQLKPDLRIIGGSTDNTRTDMPIREMNIQSEDGRTAELINEINRLAPTAIISRMPFEHQERLMTEMRNYLNAEVWLALNYQMILNHEKFAPVKKLQNKWYFHAFSRLIMKYNHKKDDDQGAEESK